MSALKLWVAHGADEEILLWDEHEVSDFVNNPESASYKVEEYEVD